MLNQQMENWNFFRFNSRSQEQVTEDMKKTPQECGFPDFDKPVWVLVEEDVNCMSEDGHESADEAPFVIGVKLVRAEGTLVCGNCLWEYIQPETVKDDSGEMVFRFIPQDQTVIAWRYIV